MSTTPLESQVATIYERTKHIQASIGEVKSYLQLQNGRVAKNTERIHDMEVILAEHLKGHESADRDLEEVKRDVRRPFIRIGAILVVMQLVQAVIMIFERIE